MPTERDGEDEDEGWRFLSVPARFTNNAPEDWCLIGLAVGDSCEESRVGDRDRKASGSGRRSGKLKRFGGTTMCTVECKEGCLTGESEGSICPSNATGPTETRTTILDQLSKDGGNSLGEEKGGPFERVPKLEG